MNHPKGKDQDSNSVQVSGNATQATTKPTAPALAVLKRRDVLAVGAGTVVVAAGGSWFMLDPTDGQRELTPEADVAWQVRVNLSYLKLDPEGLETFASMYVKWLPAQPRQPTNPTTDMVERYLKSTDFFPNGADESRDVKYVGFYDPYIIPCNLPFMPKVPDGK